PSSQLTKTRPGGSPHRPQASGPSTPPSPVAIKASRQCPTIRKGSSYTGRTAPSALIIMYPSLTLYASPSCLRQYLRDCLSGTPSASIDTGDDRLCLASCRPTGST